MNHIVTYKASKTLKKFHTAEHFVRAIMGPIGSGKSVGCIIELFRLAFLQEPNKQRIRKSRWVIVRNTYRELIDTTMQTFFDWWPESRGLYRKMDMKFTICEDLPDGTTVRAEFLFRALDKPDDVKKLLSLEVTGGFINEAREVPKQIMDMLIGRLGRYPNMRDGGATRHCLLLDTNPPDSDHWWYKLFEVTQPENHILFKQPSGTSPEAENIENLPADYYTNMQAGKDQEWIDVYVHGKYGFVQDGKSVFQEYKDNAHSTKHPIHESIDPKKTIYIGIDFGLTPAAVFGQLSPADRWLIFDELVCEDMGAKQFGKLLHKYILENYPNHNFEIYGDPAGDHRAQTDENTPFQMLASEQVYAIPTWTNDPVIRLEAVRAPLTRMDSAGNTGFVIGPKAPMIRKAMAGGYKYKRMQVTGQERFMDKPDKGRYSHVADALQYLMIGAGEGIKVISSDAESEPIDYSIIDKMVV